MKMLINANFDPRIAAFVTVTFENPESDFEVAKIEFQKLFRRLNKNVKGVKYLAVPEQHENGGWHVHLLLDRELPLTTDAAAKFVKAGTIKGKGGSWQRLWKLGQVHQKTLDGGGNMGASLAVYLQKNSDNITLAGHHGIWRSDNLQQPRELTGQDAVDRARQLADSTEHPIYSFTIQDIDYIGTLDVFEFCHDPQAALLNKAWWRMKSAS